MARISTYDLDSKVTGGDKWIGTDSGSFNKTKNFTPIRLAEYFNSSEKIDSTNSLRFYYQIPEFEEERAVGTISFESFLGLSIPLSDLSYILLSKTTEGGIEVPDFLASLIDSKVLLHKGDSMNIYGIYEITSIEDYEINSNFFKISFSFIRGNGNLANGSSYLLSVIDFGLEQDIAKHSKLILDDGTNPHGTTKNDIGLSNVDNTSDLDKPISNDTQNALDLKANTSDLSTVAFSNDYNDLDNLPTIITNHSGLNLDDGTNPHGTTKSDVGLGNVDNTSDIDKPISTATQQALDLKANAIDLDNLVPYTGATQNVDLGEFELKAGQVEFDTTPTGNAGVGILRWNDSDGTLDLGLKGGNVTLQIGQEQVVRVVNKTGFNLLESNYQAVRVNGAQGQRLKVDLAQATNDLLSAETIGLVTENIDNNQEGFVTTSGLIRGINTTGSLQGETWADGDILYLSPSVAGRITNIKPSAPNHLIVVGYVVYAHANNGSIFVKVDNGYELEELHNVTETNYATPIDADSLLTFDVTNSLWKRLSWANIKSNLKTYFDTIYQTALGFIPENVANKATNLTSPDNTKYPTTLAVSTALSGKQDTLTNPITGTGTLNFVSKFTSTGSTLGDSQIFDNGSGVGIGTTTPNYTTSGRGVLDVNGGSQSMVALSVGGVGKGFLFYTGTDLLVSNESNGAIKLNTNGSEKAIITSNGNVGIGTSSPGTLLSLYKTSYPVLTIDSGTVAGNMGIDTANNFLNVGTTSSHPLVFASNNTERMRITSSGNVGIGTTSPGSKLTVVEGVTYGVYGPNKSTISAVNTTTDGKAGFIDVVGYSGNTVSPYRWGGISGGKTSGVGDGNYGGYLSLWTTSGGGNGEADSASYERMRITSGGNVGIGTTSPSETLHVNGNLKIADGSTIKLHITDTILNGIIEYNGFMIDNTTTQFGIDVGAGAMIGVKASTDAVFVNSASEYFGLGGGNESKLVASNALMQGSPANLTTITNWIKVEDENGTKFYLPLYQ